MLLGAYAPCLIFEIFGHEMDGRIAEAFVAPQTRSQASTTANLVQTSQDNPRPYPTDRLRASAEI